MNTTKKPAYIVQVLKEKEKQKRLLTFTNKRLLVLLMLCTALAISSFPVPGPPGFKTVASVEATCSICTNIFENFYFSLRSLSSLQSCLPCILKKKNPAGVCNERLKHKNEMRNSSLDAPGTTTLTRFFKDSPGQVEPVKLLDKRGPFSVKEKKDKSA